MPSVIESLKKELLRYSSKEKAEFFPRFFKTGVGEYGYGDKFIGVTVPNSRLVAKKYNNLSLSEIQKLLESKVHEERLVALLILTEQFKQADISMKSNIYNFYLQNTKRVNNWDLVDLSCPKIVGEYLHKNKNCATTFKNTTLHGAKILEFLAKSNNLWERRIAIISTFSFIRNNEFGETLKISEMLLTDKEDLIHKAVGWMLREVGKRNIKKEEEFLKLFGAKMPRTMLRYAIEKFPEKTRLKYLRK